MKKQIILSLGILLSAITFSFSQTNDISSRIPSDAIMVINFNLGNTHSKINLDEIKKLEMVEFAYKTMKQATRKDSTILKKIYKDPNSYGINLKPSVTIAIRNNKDEYGENHINATYMMNLSNTKKFEKLMKVIFDEGTEYKDFLEAKGGYKIFKSSSFAFIWNATTLYISPVIFGSEIDAEQEIDKIVYINKTNSLASNATFSEKYISKDDINYWMDYNKFLEVYQDEIKSKDKKLFEVDLERIKGIETSFGMSFDNGKISFDAISKVNELLKQENKAIYSKQVNPEFFNYVNSDSLLGYYSMAFNIAELKTSLEKNYKNLVDTLEKSVQRKFLEKNLDSTKSIVLLQKQLDSDTLEWDKEMEIRDSLDKKLDSLVNLQMKNIDKMIDGKLKDYGLTRADAWNLFKGDFMVAATGMYDVIDTIKTIEYSENMDGEMSYNEIEKTKKVPTPLFVSMASINLIDKCKFALNKLEKDGVIKKSGDYYYVTVTKYDFFIKLNNDILIFTNDKKIVEAKYTKGKNIFGNAVSSDMIKKSIESPFYIYTDIEKILKKIPTEGEMEKKMMQPALETFKNFEASSTMQENLDLSSSASLNFKKEGNAIHILLNMANDYYKVFTNMYK